MTAPTWNLQPGDIWVREQIHGQYGGNPQAGISRSSSTPNVLISSDHHKAAAARGDHRHSQRGVRRFRRRPRHTATSRAVVGMIFGPAMISLNPAFDTDDRSNTIQAAVRLMPSTPFAYPQVVSSTFASFRVGKSGISAGQIIFCVGFDSRQLHKERPIQGLRFR